MGGVESNSHYEGERQNLACSEIVAFPTSKLEPKISSDVRLLEIVDRRQFERGFESCTADSISKRRRPWVRDKLSSIRTETHKSNANQLCDKSRPFVHIRS